MARTAALAASGAVMRHPVDEVLRPDRVTVYGLHHVLAFYAGAVVKIANLRLLDIVEEPESAGVAQ